MKTAHTPEPWEFFTGPDNDTHINAANGGCTIARLGDKCFDPDCPAEVDEADAARIISCVNHCAGINPETVPALFRFAETVNTWLLPPVPPATFDKQIRMKRQTKTP